MKIIVLSLLFLFVLPIIRAQARTPSISDPARKAILDALRKPVEKELKQAVKFKIEHYKVQGEWAFLRGTPQSPNGNPIDYRKTPYQEAIKDGVFDDWICALLQKRDGEWQVVQYIIGATDVPWEDWDKKYKAPSGIFR